MGPVEGYYLHVAISCSALEDPHACIVFRIDQILLAGIGNIMLVGCAISRSSKEC